MATDELLSVNDAIVALGIGRNTFERMVANGELRVIRYRERGQRLVPASEISRLKHSVYGVPEIDMEIGQLVTDHIDLIHDCLNAFAGSVFANRYVGDNRYTAEGLARNFTTLATMRKKLAPDDHWGWTTHKEEEHGK